MRYSQCGPDRPDGDAPDVGRQRSARGSARTLLSYIYIYACIHTSYDTCRVRDRGMTTPDTAHATRYRNQSPTVSSSSLPDRHASHINHHAWSLPHPAPGMRSISCMYTSVEVPRTRLKTRPTRSVFCLYRITHAPRVISRGYAGDSHLALLQYRRRRYVHTCTTVVRMYLDVSELHGLRETVSRAPSCGLGSSSISTRSRYG